MLSSQVLNDIEGTEAIATAPPLSVQGDFLEGWQESSYLVVHSIIGTVRKDIGTVRKDFENSP